MPETPPTAAELRLRMEGIRQDLRTEVDGIVDNAQNLMSWRYYVKRYPWVGVAAAVAAGYMAVPRKSPPTPPLQETLEKLGRGRVVFDRPLPEKKPGMLESALSITGNMLLRAGLAYAGQQMGKFVGGQPHEPPQQEVHS